MNIKTGNGMDGWGGVWVNEWVDVVTSVDVGKFFWFMFRGSGVLDVFLFGGFGFGFGFGITLDL